MLQRLPPPLTVLRQLGGADQRGDLEEVLADGAVAQALRALAGGRVALLLELHLGGWQVEVERRVLKLLGLRLGLTEAEEDAEFGQSSITVLFCNDIFKGAAWSILLSSHKKENKRDD